PKMTQRRTSLISLTFPWGPDLPAGLADFMLSLTARMRLIGVCSRLAERGVLVFLLVLFASEVSFAQIIPSNRRITWGGNCGVPGGIPARSNIFTTFSPGATAAQINSAIASCPSNQVVYLNAGTYNIAAINFGTHSGVTLRGAGPGQTIIKSTS